jgi:hypothetical protein
VVDIGVPPAIGDALGLGGSGKTWRDRVKGDAAYVSPSKKRIKFAFEDVQREVEKRGTVWEFPRVNEAYIQQRGFGARQYPLRCFFNGDEHDRIASAFELALLEPGIGTLEHPLYGTIKNVVPFGRITRADALRTAANQSVVEVTFWTTLTSVYPAAGRSAKSEIEEALGNFDVEAAQKFADGTDLRSKLSQANMKGAVRGVLSAVRTSMAAVSGEVASVRREMDSITRLINESLDVLVGSPLLLAQQIQNLILAPGRALAGISSRLEAYARLAQRIFGSKAGRPGEFPVGVSAESITRQRNDMQLADLVAMAAVSGSVLSSLENSFQTKPDAITAADEVVSQYDAAVDWRDVANADAGIVDTGASLAALQQAVALTAGFLVEVSFRLIPERVLVLDRARSIIDLSAELYGSVDNERLDLLITSNRLTGAEILEVPRGRRILYYP